MFQPRPIPTDFKEQIEKIVGEQISDFEADYHRANMLLCSSDDYLRRLKFASDTFCILCDRSALDIWREDFHTQNVFLITNETCICYSCWHDIGLQRTKWINYIYHDYQEKQREALPEPIKHEKRERRKVTGKFRRSIYELDKYRCVYCSTLENLLVEHIMPLSRGGVTTQENCVTACAGCNTKKSNRTAEEAGMELKFGRFAMGNNNE